MAVGSIIFDLLMRTASFETDTKRAEKRLKELQKEAEAFGKAFGLAITAGAATATYAIVESLAAMDELTKSAQGVGTTTEALSAYRYAAELAGLSSEQLDKALVKLGGDSPETAAAFKAMGIAQKDANGNIKDTGVLLSEVAGKFAGYEDGANKTQLAVGLFGEKLAKSMIPLLNSGSDGLAVAAAEARAFGQVIDTEAARAAEQFNDNLTRLGKAVGGVANTMAAELLPILNGITDEFVGQAKEGNNLGQMFAKGIAEVLKVVIVLGSDVAFVFKGVGREIGGMAAQLTALATLDFDGFSAIGDAMKADAANARKELDAFQARIMALDTGIPAPSPAATEGTAKKIIAPIIAAKEKADKELSALLKMYERMQAEADRIAEAVATPAEKATKAKGQVNELADLGFLSPEVRDRAIAAAEKTYEDYVTSQRDQLKAGLLSEEEEIKQSFERRRRMILALTEATEQEKADAVAALSEQRDAKLADARYQRYSDLLSQEEQATHDYMERKRKIEDDETLSAEQRTAFLVALGEQYHARMQELDEADQKKRDALAKQQAEMVSQGFANMADIAKAFGGEQSKTYQALFAASKAFTVADITLKQAQAIAKAWGENNYWVAVGLTAGLAAQFQGLLSAANSASFGGARAAGGPVNAGRDYLVGERGPEVFRAPANGRIIPNDALGPQAAPEVNLRVINAFDMQHVGDYLGSVEGERALLNFVRRNGAAIRAA